MTGKGVLVSFCGFDVYDAEEGTTAGGVWGGIQGFFLG